MKKCSSSKWQYFAAVLPSTTFGEENLHDIFRKETSSLEINVNFFGVLHWQQWQPPASTPEDIHTFLGIQSWGWDTLQTASNDWRQRTFLSDMSAHWDKEITYSPLELVNLNISNLTLSLKLLEIILQWKANINFAKLICAIRYIYF